MTEQYRASRPFHDIHRRSKTGVAQIHQHADSFEFGHQASTEASQTAVGRFRTPAADGVCDVECEKRVFYAQAIVSLHQIEVAFETARALEVKSHTQSPGFLGPDHISDVLN